MEMGTMENTLLPDHSVGAEEAASMSAGLGRIVS